jgi:hypothetical protein
MAVAAALLSFVHLAGAAAQESHSPSQRQAITSEIDGLVRQVLADRISAKDIPDWGVLRDATRIAIVPTLSGCPSGRTPCQRSKATSLN